jgi:hypothetical protein
LSSQALVVVTAYSSTSQPALHGRARYPFAPSAGARTASHTKLHDCLGDFLVRISCPCGASRHIEPEALARIAGRSATFAALATRMRCSQCGKKVAEVVAVARPD